MEMDWSSFGIGFVSGVAFVILFLGFLTRDWKVFNP